MPFIFKINFGTAAAYPNVIYAIVRFDTCTQNLTLTRLDIKDVVSIACLYYLIAKVYYVPKLHLFELIEQPSNHLQWNMTQITQRGGVDIVPGKSVDKLHKHGP